MKKALFLDRDGVINEDTCYPHKPEHVVFKPGIFDFCGKAVSKGYILVVVTNQAGVAKGLFTADDVVALHDWMGKRFLEQGIPVAGFYYCPYHVNAVIDEYRKDSEFRKPKPGMILQAAKELDIDLAQSLMIGDRPTDRILLDGFRSMVIKSGYTGEDYDVENLDEILLLL